LLFDARDGHALPFSSRARWGWRLRWLIYSWVVMVTARVIHSPPYLAESAPAFFAGSFVFWFFCFVFVYFFVFSCTVYLCIAQILLNFVLAKC
jgi:membrane protein YdbS with pleckstrin-like domain